MGAWRQSRQAPIPSQRTQKCLSFLPKGGIYKNATLLKVILFHSLFAFCFFVCCRGNCLKSDV